MIDEKKRIEILEDRIALAFSLIDAGHLTDALMELHRALRDPDMQLGATVTHMSDCAQHNAPAYVAGHCDCR